MNYNKVDIANLVMTDNQIVCSLTKEEIIDENGVFLGYTNELDTDREELGAYFLEIENKAKVNKIPKGYNFALSEEMKGYFLYSKEEKVKSEDRMIMPKMYRVYRDSDLFCFFKDKNMDIKDVMPADNILIVDVTKRDIIEDGIILSDDRDIDPRELSLEGAVVISIGKDVKSFNNGDLVFFPPSVGRAFIGYNNGEQVKLKAIQESSCFCYEKDWDKNK